MFITVGDGACSSKNLRYTDLRETEWPRVRRRFLDGRRKSHYKLRYTTSTSICIIIYYTAQSKCRGDGAVTDPSPVRYLRDGRENKPEYIAMHSHGRRKSTSIRIDNHLPRPVFMIMYKYII